jgi:hypothetical protein
MRTIAGFLLVAFGLLSAPIAASAQSGDAAHVARAVVEKQLDAFAHEDEQAAYALAAPGIRDRFPDAGQFMEMVRLQYPAVVRHRSVDFGPSAAEGDQARQTVTFVDDDNVVWTALYTLARQPDGQWLIAGCMMAKSDDTAL